MKILVTGGGGFIGSSLIQNLALNNEITCIGHGSNYGILRKTIPHPVKWINGDITDLKLLKTAMKNIETVVHLAGIAGERLCKEDPCGAVLSNITGTHHLLRQAILNNVRHFIFSSSYWVYSFFEERPLPLKEDDPLRTDSFYGSLKAASELQLLASGNEDLKVTILRLATVYGYGAGVGAQWRGLIGRYVESAHKNKPISVFGDGNQKIDFVHIDDVIKVFNFLIRNTYKENDSCSVLNIGGGKAVSILEIANMVKELTFQLSGIKTEIQFQPPPPGKIWPDRWLAIKKVQQLLPDFPAISLEEGIKEMMQHYKRNLL